MNKVIDFTKTIYELCNEYPEIVDVMKELGFDSIGNSAMLNTAGRFMTIYKGASMKKIDIDIIKNEFIKKGFIVKE